jgi:hypothetical protein
MTQEQKDLLLKDLCARLPYKVKIQCINSDNETVIEELFTMGIEEDSFDCNMIEYKSVKPYLFPLSSMTKVQEDEWYDAFIDPLSKRTERHTRQEDLQLQADSKAFGIAYLLKNHFDIYGLIPMGLAIDATDKNIY